MQESISEIKHRSAIFSRDADKLFLATFVGVPVRVDANLKGNEWFCAVSPKIYDELNKLKD